MTYIEEDIKFPVLAPNLLVLGQTYSYESRRDIFNNFYFELLFM